MCECVAVHNRLQRIKKVSKFEGFAWIKSVTPKRSEAASDVYRISSESILFVASEIFRLRRLLDCSRSNVKPLFEPIAVD